MIEINDTRELTEFKGITFSNYKKNNVVSELLKSMDKMKLENACYWCAELICAGYYLDIWNTIIEFYSVNIHLGNPKLVVYIERKLKCFISILKNGYIGQELRLRNNEAIRKLFCELICVLCFSDRKPCIQYPKIDIEEMDITNITNRFTAPNVDYGKDYLDEDDPKELFIPINELIYNLEEKKLLNSLYWINWILCFESICEKKKQKLVCKRRCVTNIESKFQNNVIWLIWDIVFKMIEKCKKNKKVIKEITKSSLSLFQLQYKKSDQKKRLKVLYYIVSLLLDNNVDYSHEILKNSDANKIKTVLDKIDEVFKDVKKNEVSPNTDYLFHNLKSNTNLEKSIEKLEALKSFENMD